MNEVLLVAEGAVLALCFVVLLGCAWFARDAADSASRARKLGGDAVDDVKRAAAGIAEAHNDLVRTQAEQGQTLERLLAEVAGRSLRR
jgi:hypothetical protein